MPFQLIAVVAIALWLAAIACWYRKSVPLLLGGLGCFALYALASAVNGEIAWTDIGLRPNVPLATTLAWAVGWLAPMFLLSPVADRVATKFVATPPDLSAFKAIQESWLKLAAGILFAWVAGGFVEELVLRGVLLTSVEALTVPIVSPAVAAIAGVLAAAVATYVIHLYQGLRAALIVAQLSILFGILFLLSGHNLLAVVACHGLFDTVAFVRFGLKRSKYSTLDS